MSFDLDILAPYPPPPVVRIHSSDLACRPTGDPPQNVPLDPPLLFTPADIYEANWLTLTSDLGTERQYDAVICLGNSFAHLPDLTGNQDSHR